MNTKKLSNFYNNNLFLLSFTLLLIIFFILISISYYFHFSPLHIFNHTFNIAIPLTIILFISIPLFIIIISEIVESKTYKDKFYDLVYLNFMYKTVGDEDEKIGYVIFGILIYLFAIYFLNKIDIYSLVIIFGSLLTLGLSFTFLSFNYMMSSKVSKDKMFLATNRFSMATIMSAYMMMIMVFIKIVLVPIAEPVLGSLSTGYILDPSLTSGFIEFFTLYLVFILYQLLLVISSLIMIKFVRDLVSGMKEFLSEIIIFRFQNTEVEGSGKLNKEKEEIEITNKTKERDNYK